MLGGPTEIPTEASMIKTKPKKFPIALILSMQAAFFLDGTGLPSIASRLAEEQYAVLTEAHNRVYKRDFIDWSKEIWGDPIPAKKGEMLREGMQVGTANKSWAEISWPSVTTRAWENSVVAISPGKRLVYLLNGEMLFQLDKNRKNKGDTVIWTRVLQLRLHGTSVLVQAMKDFTRVAVLEGVIDVTNRYDNSVISLKPGTVYEVRTGSAPVSPQSNNRDQMPQGGFGNTSTNSFGQGNSPTNRSNSGQSNQNYANQLNSSDWQAFKEMKERMPGIPDPQNWGASDYQKFNDMKSKWSFMKQQEEAKKQQEEDYKKQYWQNKENQISPQDWQKRQKLQEMKEQWERDKYNKGATPQSTIDFAIGTIDGEPDIYPYSPSNYNFDNLVNNSTSKSFAEVKYGQECPQGQSQSQGNCYKDQNADPQCNMSDSQKWQKDQSQNWKQDCQQQHLQNCPQNMKSGLITNWQEPQTPTMQKPPSLFSAPPIAGSRWDTHELAPLTVRAKQSVKNTDSAFVKEIVSWNAPPINVFRTDRSATNIYLADTDAILKHPLLSSSYGNKIASHDLIASSLGRYSAASKGLAGDPTQVRNQVFDESVAVLQSPTVSSYQTGSQISPGNKLPGARKELNSALNR